MLTYKLVACFFAKRTNDGGDAEAFSVHSG